MCALVVYIFLANNAAEKGAKGAAKSSGNGEPTAMGRGKQGAQQSCHASKKRVCEACIAG